MGPSSVDDDPIGAALPSEVLMGLYRRMNEIRAFEDRVQELFFDGLIQGTTHLCQGQEAVAVGSTMALAPEDYMTVTYRGHGQSLARGLPPESAFAELMGKSTGCCGGMGGSMHLADGTLGLLGSFAIVGAGLPVAVGAALSSKLQGNGRVAMTFCGDGATNIGTFHEALNMAAVWKAPVVFVVENNLYGEYSPLAETTAVGDIALRGAAYGIPSEIVDGQDLIEVYQSAKRAVARARAGEGPTLIEAKTYRFRGHSRTDPGNYRPPEELDAWLARDPITLFGTSLASSGVLSEASAAELRESVVRDIDAASERAISAPVPTIDDVRRHVYAGQG
jgi:pyruvate dehydrogenase E1 component alpha subunit